MTHSCATCRSRLIDAPWCDLLVNQVDNAARMALRHYLAFGRAKDCKEWARTITDEERAVLLSECRSVFPGLEWVDNCDMGDGWVGAESEVCDEEVTIGRSVDEAEPWAACWASGVVEATGDTAHDCLVSLADAFHAYFRDGLAAVNSARGRG